MRHLLLTAVLLVIPRVDAAPVPLLLGRFDGPDNAFVATPEQVEIRGPMSVRAIPASPPALADNVIEFEYFCIGGVPSFAILPGPPFKAVTARHLPAIGHSETWSTYASRISTATNPLPAGWKEIRLDLPLPADRTLQVRNVRLRPERPGEFAPIIAKTSASSSKEAPPDLPRPQVPGLHRQGFRWRKIRPGRRQHRRGDQGHVSSRHTDGPAPGRSRKPRNPGRNPSGRRRIFSDRHTPPPQARWPGLRPPHLPLAVGPEVRKGRASTLPRPLRRSGSPAVRPRLRRPRRQTKRASADGASACFQPNSTISAFPPSPSTWWCTPSSPSSPDPEPSPPAGREGPITSAQARFHDTTRRSSRRTDTEPWSPPSCCWRIPPSPRIRWCA